LIPKASHNTARRDYLRRSENPNILLARGHLCRTRGVRSAGAREVHLRISCPPTISPCFYGVDTPDKRELIAANNSVEEIRKFVEADSLGYLSLEALRRAVGDDQHQFCYACYTGDYPTDLVHIEDLLASKAHRGR
jgi:amidophosphoribosyltransferase